MPLPVVPRFLAPPSRRESTFLSELLRKEAVGGMIVLLAAMLAVGWANSGSADTYEALRHWVPVEWLGLDLQHWAADGALTLFFFLAGLELKRELLVGSLRRPADALVPIVAALGGVAVPATIFVVANLGTDAVRGWAIPAATDIAFALAVLAIVGTALPTQLRAFLLTLAIVDDLVVIVVIAVFYTEDLAPTPLLTSAAALGLYALMQRLRVRTALLLVPVALVAWWFMYQSGVHATIAGVALGLLTRALPDDDEAESPAERLEHRLTPLAAGLAVPFFALMSAGVVVELDTAYLTDPVVLGVVLGLVVGKPVGVLAGAWLTVRLTRARLDPSLSWAEVVGVAVVAGIGFTVALLVAELSYTGARAETAKSAVLLGSVLAALAASLVLGLRNRTHRRAAETRADTSRGVDHSPRRHV